MTDQEIDQFYESSPCEKEGCQCIYNRYVKTYSQLVQERQHTLFSAEEKEATLRDHARQIESMALQHKQTQFLLDKESGISNALQGKCLPEDPGPSVPTSSLTSTCPNCAMHRSLVVTARTIHAADKEGIKKRNQEMKELLEASRAENLQARLAAARLRQELDAIKKKDPSAAFREIAKLKEEVEVEKKKTNTANQALERMTQESALYQRKWTDIKERANAAENELSEAKFKVEMMKSQLDPFNRPRDTYVPVLPRLLEGENLQLKQRIEELESENAQLKRKIDTLEQVKKEPAIDTLEPAIDREYILGMKRSIDELYARMPKPEPMDDFVQDKMRSVFLILDTHEEAVDENKLYDAFLDSISPDEHEKYLEAMYLMCNPGGSLQAKGRQQIKQGGKRVCKSSFSKCLEAIGGVIKMAGTQKIWTNVSIVAPKVRRTG